MGINSTSSMSFIRLENILIIGNGGRENSLAWAIQKNELVKKEMETLAGFASNLESKLT